MGCFLGCFGSCKDNKRRKQRKKVIPRDQRHGNPKAFQATVSVEQGTTEKPETPVSELREKSGKQLSPSTRKRVTFDSNVTTYEHVSVYESTESLTENDKVNQRKEEETATKSSQSSSLSEDDSTISSVGSYPPNHRYQNFRDSDDEFEDLDNEDSDLDDEDVDIDDDGDYGDYNDDADDRIVCEKVWSESIPTESMESRTEVRSAEVLMGEVESPLLMCGLPDKEVNRVDLNRNARDRSVYVHPVLNPVENLTQWKAVKSKGTPQHKPQKENFTADLEPTTNIKQCDQHKNPSQEIAVDASLSTWLFPNETTPILPKKTGSAGLETNISEKSMSQGSKSITSFDDRPILGALTVEELKQLSASSSTTPRRSPSRSPDEMPIIGTVGTYWNYTSSVEDSSVSASSFKGIPNMTSKYREDKTVNWHTTPFEKRMERALNCGATEA